MDLDDFRSILETSGVDVWSFIDTAISVASADYGDELRHRRDGIVERLYGGGGGLTSGCRSCHAVDQPESVIKGKGGSSSSPLSEEEIVVEDEEEEEEQNRDLQYDDLFEEDDEKVKILTIKEHLEDPDQPEESVVDLLQTLADMDITFKALKDTDIGRHVSRLRKHSSSEVRRLVKQLVRKWKELVDDWMRLNTPGDLAASSRLIDGDSPQQKVAQSGNLQVPDFGYSPNPHNGSSGSDKNYAEAEPKVKPNPRREAPAKPVHSNPVAAYTPPNKQKERKESSLDADRLASARKRLQDNYKEAANAKKQRTIQVMDLHEIPKPKNKNVFFAKNKGASHGRRHW